MTMISLRFGEIHADCCCWVTGYVRDDARTISIFWLWILESKIERASSAAYTYIIRVNWSICISWSILIYFWKSFRTTASFTSPTMPSDKSPSSVTEKQFVSPRQRLYIVKISAPPRKRKADATGSSCLNNPLRISSRWTPPSPPPPASTSFDRAPTFLHNQAREYKPTPYLISHEQAEEIKERLIQRLKMVGGFKIVEK